MKSSRLNPPSSTPEKSAESVPMSDGLRQRRRLEHRNGAGTPRESFAGWSVGVPLAVFIWLLVVSRCESSEILSALSARPDSFRVHHAATADEQAVIRQRARKCVMRHDIVQDVANTETVHLAPGWFAHTGRVLFYNGKCMDGGEGTQTLLYHRARGSVDMLEFASGLIANMALDDAGHVRLTIRLDGCCDDESAVVSIVEFPLAWPVRDTTLARILTGRSLDLSRSLPESPEPLRVAADSVRLNVVPREFRNPGGPFGGNLVNSMNRDEVEIAVFKKGALGTLLGRDGRDGEWVLLDMSSWPLRALYGFRDVAQPNGANHWVGWCRASDVEPAR